MEQLSDRIVNRRR